MTKAALFFIGLCLLTVAASARTLSHRQKRVSDQRLAELETLIALAKMRGKLVTVPVALGRIDPSKIGRRRRSVSAETSYYDDDWPYSINDGSLENVDDYWVSNSPQEYHERTYGATAQSTERSQYSTQGMKKSLAYISSSLWRNFLVISKYMNYISKSYG